MAFTLSLPLKAYVAGNLNIVCYNFTAASSGDTVTVTIPAAYPFLSLFFDANGNQIITSLPTFGSWTTTGNLSSATLTANAGGAGVTNGHMILMYGAN